MKEHMDKNKIAQMFLPYFMADQNEPFPIKAIGYTIFEQEGRSFSCNHFVDWDAKKSNYVIEYAVFFDFDIQHLYDLEHVFVYVGKENEIQRIELSFHGKFLNGMLHTYTKIKENTHPVVYMQPGKHAMMGDPQLFQLFIGLEQVCNKDAGRDGFLIAPMFEKIFKTDDNLNHRIEKYLKETYVFFPSMNFAQVYLEQSILMPYSDLEALIEKRINKWKDKILNIES